MPQTFPDSKEWSLAASFLNDYARKVADTPTDDSLRRVKEDGFKFLIGNDRALLKLSGDEDFVMSLDNGLYSAQWSRGDRTIVKCVFPAKIGLLTFSSKKGLENRMADLIKLRSEDTIVNKLPTVPVKELTPVKLSEFYILDRGYYITPRLSNKIIFDKAEGDSCKVLIDNNHYQLETISNIMLSGYNPMPLTLNVTLDLYGYKKSKIKLRFESMYNLLSQEGSTPYWGVETFDGKEIKGLYVWVNTYGGFAHVLTVTLPVESITTSQDADVGMHSYIRLDNLKSMFEEYSTK